MFSVVTVFLSIYKFAKLFPSSELGAVYSIVSMCEVVKYYSSWKYFLERLKQQIGSETLDMF